MTTEPLDLAGGTGAPGRSGGRPVWSSAHWFGPSERPLFGWWSGPEGGRARGGVVLCAPLGDEARHAHRTFRRLAEMLAATGFLVLRYDHPGTDDSAGRLDELDAAAWVDAAETATQLVRSTGVPFVAGIGMRLGATLLSQVIERERCRLDALVLWDPCFSGRTFLREQQLLQATFVPSVVPPEAGVETPGYLFPAELAAQLGRLELSGAPAKKARTLVLVRDDREPSGRLVQRLGGIDRIEEAIAGSTGSDGVPDVPGVRWARARGQGALLDEAIRTEVPQATLVDIVAWVSDAAPSREVDIAGVPAATDGAGPDVPGPAGGSPGAPGASVLVPTARADGGTVAVVERAIRLGPHDLFGIATEPVGGSRSPWIVFLNVATEHHVGPGRAWVDLARSWAIRGLRSLRFDLSGVGDSPTGAGQAEDVTYARQWLDELPDTLELLAGADHPDVVLIGLCSGAYQALEAGIATGARGVCAISAALTSFDLNRRTPRYDRRRKAYLPVPAPLARLGERHARTVWWLWRAYRQVAVRQAPMAVPARAVAAGCDVLLVSGTEDAAPFEEVLYWRAVGGPRLRRTGRLSFLVDDSIDHALLSHAGRQRALQLLSDHVLSRYVPAAP